MRIINFSYQHAVYTRRNAAKRFCFRRADVQTLAVFARCVIKSTNGVRIKFNLPRNLMEKSARMKKFSEEGLWCGVTLSYEKLYQAFQENPTENPLNRLRFTLLFWCLLVCFRRSLTWLGKPTENPHQIESSQPHPGVIFKTASFSGLNQNFRQAGKTSRRWSHKLYLEKNGQ